MKNVNDHAAFLGVELTKTDNPIAVENALVKFSLLDYRYPGDFEIAKYNDLRYKAASYIKNNMELRKYFTYIEGLKDETYFTSNAYSKENAAVDALFQYRNAGFTLTDVDKIYVETKEKYMAPEIVGVFDINLNEFYGPWPQWVPSSKEKVSDGNKGRKEKAFKCSYDKNGFWTEIREVSPEQAALMCAKIYNYSEVYVFTNYDNFELYDIVDEYGKKRAKFRGVGTSSKNSPDCSPNSTKSYKCGRFLNGVCTEVQASSPAEAAAFYVHTNLATPCNVYVDDKKYAVQKSGMTSDYFCALYDDIDPWGEDKWEGPFSAADLSATAPSSSPSVSDGNSKEQNLPNNSIKSYRCNHVLNRPRIEVQASSPAEAAHIYIKNVNLVTPCKIYVDDTYFFIRSSVPSDASSPSISYTSLGQEVGALVDEKQKQYGDSFSKAHVILTSLYPDGVRPDQYTDMLACVRIIDKLFRIAQRKQDGQDLGGESPYRDIAGYGLLGMKKDNDATDKPGPGNACNFDDTDVDALDDRDRDY